MKKLIKNLFRLVGFEIRRKGSFLSGENHHLTALLNLLNTDLLLDVGGNVGDFAKKVRSSGYAGTILSIEPLTEAHQQLTKRAKSDPKWIVFRQLALGEKDREGSLHIANNLVSSSFLPMMKVHLDAAPHSAYVGMETVPIRRLAPLWPEISAGFQSVFLKLDVQGYEWQVLQGALPVLSEIAGIQIELNVDYLYDGQKSWLELIQFLESQDFVFWGSQTIFFEKQTGRALSIDGFFVHKKFVQPYS